MDVSALVELMTGRRVVVLTGAGCSTESGIPDYRGVDTPPRTRPPIQHREFIDKRDMRQRYWARSMIGWPKLAGAAPNAGHRALAGLERAGAIEGIITQNVDGLHQAAGSAHVVELHGALARVRCLGCDAITSREALQSRLLARNGAWLARAAGVRVEPGEAEVAGGVANAKAAPDGDVDLSDELVAGFDVPPCEHCGGTLMPDVVFFGGSVPRSTLDAAWALFDRGELLLVVGSSLTVFSGYRFVRRAAEREIPIAILNRGPTRGDPHAQLRVDAYAGTALERLAHVLA